MSDIKFSKSHEWVKIEGDTATVGISNYAQEELGDIVFVDLPDVEDTISCGDNFADVESVKAASELYSPISGTILAVNEELEDSPEKINSDPYDAWIIKLGDLGETSELLTEKEYEALVQEEKES